MKEYSTVELKELILKDYAKETGMLLRVLGCTMPDITVTIEKSKTKVEYPKRDIVPLGSFRKYTENDIAHIVINHAIEELGFKKNRITVSISGFEDECIQIGLIEDDKIIDPKSDYYFTCPDCKESLFRWSRKNKTLIEFLYIKANKDELSLRIVEVCEEYDSKRLLPTKCYVAYSEETIPKYFAYPEPVQRNFIVNQIMKVKVSNL